MSIPDVVKEAKGKWAGTSTLRLAWSPENVEVFESPSELEVIVGDHQAFATLRYSWVHEGQNQFGELLICGDSAGWSDSWHQSGTVMRLEGSGTGFRVTGSYSWEGSPPWGWRIEITRPDQDGLALEMTNISPEGEEEWAVRGNYRRS